MFSLPSRMCILLIKKPQNDGVRGMATLKAISMRLKSVKNIQKITQSMKMVSAAKFARAERDLKQVKPMGDGIKSFYANAEIGQTDEQPKEEQKLLYVAMTSDRGLCGAVHSSVAKVIKNAVPDDASDNVKIVCVGEKARVLLHRLFQENILLVCQEVGRLPPTFLDASRIANEIIQSEFQFETGKVVYNRFRSVVSYLTEEIEFYSLETVLESPQLSKYDDTDEETLASFVEFTMTAAIFYAMKEGACSEQSSRMTAMDNSSKNAGDMINKLTLTFNRTRQAVITRELIEIISGASAL